ncbi:acyloxyacyl hydrolase-like [Oscarella lobularis]|uniref:acyloxyacyl hydrolase-like n=1 Tax=Oscarella lobularis TaxID=121494 RepID=UPI00331375BE
MAFTPCLPCTALFAVLDQLATYHNETMTDSVIRFCSYVPSEWHPLTDTFCKWPRDELRALEGYDPDYICHNVFSACVGYDECFIFKSPKKVNVRFQRDAAVTEAEPHYWCRSGFNFGILCNLEDAYVNAFGKDKIYVPPTLDDKDRDRFSPSLNAYRGAYWHGKDCNDSDGWIRPGALPTDGDALIDSNCNGIVGMYDSERTREDVFCCNVSISKNLGVIVLGDSAAAHFHIPPQWLEVQNMSSKTYDNLYLALANEFDWPMLSMATGFMNSTWASIGAQTQSIYNYLLNWNRCNRNDFQNLAFNGATMKSVSEQLPHQWSRRSIFDKPALVILATIGNDVCNGHVTDTLAHMTTPEDMTFYAKNVLLQLNDDRLRKGSHVIIIGTADGRLLYDQLHARYYPLGKLRRDVTYSDFYEWLTCLHENPCIGYLSSNETLRNLTYQRSQELNQALSDVVAQFRSDVIDVHFYADLYKDTFTELKETWPEDKLWEVVEPVDGFHPGQVFEATSAKILWRWIQKTIPHAIGPSNQYNGEIDAYTKK